MPWQMHSYIYGIVICVAVAVMASEAITYLVPRTIMPRLPRRWRGAPRHLAVFSVVMLTFAGIGWSLAAPPSHLASTYWTIALLVTFAAMLVIGPPALWRLVADERRRRVGMWIATILGTCAGAGAMITLNSYVRHTMTHEPVAHVEMIPTIIGLAAVLAASSIIRRPEFCV